MRLEIIQTIWVVQLLIPRNSQDNEALLLGDSIFLRLEMQDRVSGGKLVDLLHTSRYLRIETSVFIPFVSVFTSLCSSLCCLPVLSPVYLPLCGMSAYVYKSYCSGYLSTCRMARYDRPQKAGGLEVQNIMGTSVICTVLDQYNLFHTPTVDLGYFIIGYSRDLLNSSVTCPLDTRGSTWQTLSGVVCLSEVADSCKDAGFHEDSRVWCQSLRCQYCST